MSYVCIFENKFLSHSSRRMHVYITSAITLAMPKQELVAHSVVKTLMLEGPSPQIWDLPCAKSKVLMMESKSRFSRWECARGTVQLRLTCVWLACCKRNYVLSSWGFIFMVHDKSAWPLTGFCGGILKLWQKSWVVRWAIHLHTSLKVVDWGQTA